MTDNAGQKTGRNTSVPGSAVPDSSVPGSSGLDSSGLDSSGRAAPAPAPSGLRTVLVANRGEIACRVFRTCRGLGLATVAVHSDADAQALHVRTADAAVRLPGDSPADTYLRGDLIVKAALTAGADAIHPGYGFLSENADFARQVLDAGLVWIGPPPAAIAAMASKTRAKELMAEAGVPLLRPVDPERATGSDLPLLIKAAAGGGGRGMRLVRDLAELPAELAAASAEAASAFGDGEVFAEPYVENGRHVEVQILADTHGTVWALGTRDCSLQRRHQKVIEEAPAPGLPQPLRDTLHTAAAEAARAIGYTGAGTVEFLVSAEHRAYFLEMNTRLQVEHPVTEEVYGLDLVAWQLRVAEGAELPARPPEPAGHAVEARLYAEDPSRDWQPQSGPLHRLDVPGVRLDTGFTGGDTIGVHYDPMLAKAIVHAPTRAEAVRRLADALSRARVHGPVTNRDLLVRSLRHPEFAAGRVDTGFYDRNLPELTAPTAAGPTVGQQPVGERPVGEQPVGERPVGQQPVGEPPAGEQPAGARPAGARPVGGSAGADPAVGLSALAAALAATAVRTGPASSLPARLGGWRNLPSGHQTTAYRAEPDGTEYEVRHRLTRDGLDAPGHPDVRLIAAGPERVTLETAGVRRTFEVAVYGSRTHVDSPLGAHAFTAVPRFPDPTARAEPGSLLAPMPGTVVRVADIAVGDRVEQGQSLLWLEAMKMEHRITAPAPGTLTVLHATPGRQVEVGALLAVVTEGP
ncbi:acety-l/propionyl-CoA carboxylase subunit alpha [Streptomyces sp. F63]|uniref:ATP-binding protein n=1 Tax=Streptomyces sp. F63 TaxID=2824887 RepID=UPI001B35C497|nr:biotin carboxylase N-terminal domain-containing protein [Streptomyces sp. F63]MBQ0988398.1 acety-l/propionyl-CoA carboxylase subunit alpha [Streptomyces sp. F63]